ncbi:questin oxidase family protein [Dongia soli]|uniref:Questin oxidase family protein n=1 Tax=Dongia soli TaxID=600628 RepID=A0ABU5EE00_9PROT|nr:questin oxidase family protein [Dongia soli]MDY0884284.1 questin oxidase family protein [Dongia soli]
MAKLLDDIAALAPEVTAAEPSARQFGEPASQRMVGLGNHLPMALLALDRLGASPRQLGEFAAAYRKRLVPLADMTMPVVTDPGELRGEIDAFPRLEVFYRTALARDEHRAVLQRHLPSLLTGIAGAALHPLIRLAYGLLGGTRSEIAAGLAHATIRYRTLPAGSTVIAPMEADPRILLRRLRADAAFDYKPQADIPIDAAIFSASDRPRFAAVVDDLILADDPWRQLAPVAAAFHVVRDDALSLHAVAGIHATRIIAGELDKPAARQLWHHVWRAVSALYLAAGKPELPSAGYLAQLRDQVGRVEDAPDWPGILARAAETPDALAAIFTFTCLEEGRRSGDRLYRWLAWRAIT